VRDLYSVFKDLEQEILAHQTVDTFNEIFKVVFAKLYDERVNLYTSTAVAKFRIGLTETAPSAATRARKLFADAMRKWKDVYSANDVITLNDDNIAYCVKALQPFHLIRSGDVLGVAFELLVNQEMKGDMGQYFTPRQVVDMMVKMMAPKLEESVCDPACGSGGFLIYAMREVFRFIDTRWDDPDDRAEQRKDYAQDKLLGMDNDSRLVRVAKAYMIMENDGRSGINYADSLDYGAWDKSLKSAVVGRGLKGSGGQRR
jgi:type I restriction enzyme M protein